MIVTPQVRVFDPLTDETVDVVQITGGNPTLRPETTKIQRISALLAAGAGRGARSGPRTRLQLSASHSIVFSDKIEIRPGLDQINLLEGGQSESPAGGSGTSSTGRQR